MINQHTATLYSQSVNLTQSHSSECHSPMSLALFFFFSKKAQSDTAISHSMALPNPISSHVDCIRIGRHSWRPEVTYHILGQRDGSGKVPGVAGRIIQTPRREQFSLLFTAFGDSFKSSSLNVKQSLLSDSISDWLCPNIAGKLF